MSDKDRVERAKQKLRDNSICQIYERISNKVVDIKLTEDELREIIREEIDKYMKVYKVR